MQERDEAARLFGADAAAAANGEKTFEPGEGMVEAEPPAAEPAAEPVVEEPSVRKGPTQEQLTAIKARPGGNCPSRVGGEAIVGRVGREDCACWLSEDHSPNRHTGAYPGRRTVRSCLPCKLMFTGRTWCRLSLPHLPAGRGCLPMAPPACCSRSYTYTVPLT
jgi:hypothetical protein